MQLNVINLNHLFNLFDTEHWDSVATNESNEKAPFSPIMTERMAWEEECEYESERLSDDSDSANVLSVFAMTKMR